MKKKRKLFVVMYDERHVGDVIVGITSHKDWAESEQWIENANPGGYVWDYDSSDRFFLDDPEIFPEARKITFNRICLQFQKVWSEVLDLLWMIFVFLRR
jgi:hypothetical protein